MTAVHCSRAYNLLSQLFRSFHAEIKVVKNGEFLCASLTTVTGIYCDRLCRWLVGYVC